MLQLGAPPIERLARTRATNQIQTQNISFLVYWLSMWYQIVAEQIESQEGNKIIQMQEFRTIQELQLCSLSITVPAFDPARRVVIYLVTLETLVRNVLVFRDSDLSSMWAHPDFLRSLASKEGAHEFQQSMRPLVRRIKICLLFSKRPSPQPMLIGPFRHCWGTTFLKNPKNSSFPRYGFCWLLFLWGGP